MAHRQHRTSYRSIPHGRDGYIVKAIGPWLESTLLRELRERGGSLPTVIDIGCGEQPLRSLVEGSGARYLGVDVEQNAQGTVDVLGFLDRELPSTLLNGAHDVVLCTEVLEHVADWDASFRNLRALVAQTGVVIVTLPFIFPLHMEPVDFLRGTPYVIDRLAAKHGFTVAESHRLGPVRDVISTILDDLSILPAKRSIFSRLTAHVLRVARRTLVRILQSDTAWAAVQLNSNTYLSNAVVLRPIRAHHGLHVYDAGAR
jgi:hypothetical protein